MRWLGTICTAALVLLGGASHSEAASSYFDILSGSEVISGPPYPTACHRTEVAHEASSIFERDGQLALGLRRAADGTGALVDLELHADEGQAMGAGYEAITSFDLRYRSHTDKPYPSDSAVRFIVELASPGGRPGKLTTLHPELPVTDSGRYFDMHQNATSLEIISLVEFDRGVRHELTFLVELPPELSLLNSTIVIREQSLQSGERAGPTLVDTYFTAHPDALFDVGLRLEGDEEDLDELSSVLSLTLTGRFLGGISPVEATTWGAIKSLYGN